MARGFHRVRARGGRSTAGRTQNLQHRQSETRRGKPIVGATVFSPDPNMYCAVANSGYDFTWIEMQHSPLTFEDVAHMIWACRGASAMPFVRVPDATESDIQKATDIGALGIIVPTVDTVEKAEAAVKWAKYPPMGRRSMGNGQYGRALWPRLPPDRQRQHGGGDHDRDAASAWRMPRRSPRCRASTSSSPPASIWAISPDTSRAIRNTKPGQAHP